MSYFSKKKSWNKYSIFANTLILWKNVLIYTHEGIQFNKPAGT